jgi:glycosyltransferase involved in cell wall biosynthesis
MGRLSRNRGRNPARQPDGTHRRVSSAEEASQRQLTRVGLVLDQILFKKDGLFSTDEVFIRFVEAVARRRFDRIQFCSRVTASESGAPYDLDPSLFEVLPLGWYADIAQLCLRAPVLLPGIRRTLSRAMPGWDLAIAFGIHPLTPLVLRMARRRALPTILWIRGDLLSDLRHRLSGPRRRLALLVARAVLALLPGGTPVISMGREDFPFLSRMGPVHVAYSSKFGEEDFVSLPRPRRPAGTQTRVLYVGRIAPEKGLEVLLRAMEILGERRSSGVQLSVVGSDYFGSFYAEEFRKRVATSPAARNVELIGPVPYGPELFEFYDTHDLLVLPSYTEGFPQVLLEAMARGIPVLATHVGGVPRIVEHETTGLLVSPGQPDALAEGMNRLLQHPELATRLALGGQRVARAYVRDVQAESVARFLDHCYPGAPFAEPDPRPGA